MTCETITLANTNLFIPIFLRGVFNTHYKIEKELAVGGFGIVYKGILLNDECIKERNNGNSDCVIKTLFDVNPEMFFQELSILHLFKKEKYFAKMLCYSENPYHIVLKYYKYGSLFHFIYSKNANIIPSMPYSLGASLHLAERMTYAFHLMHSKGYTHNDIKLANILLDGDESEKIFPVITDFGIAHILDSAVVAAGFKIKNVKAGTLEYCAPEVLVSFENNQIISNVKTDVYSIGIVLIELFRRSCAWKQFDPKVVIHGGFPNISVKKLLDNYQDITKTKAILILRIILLCIEFEPLKRPIMAELNSKFQNMEAENSGE